MFEWDENKRLANLEKHGLDFSRAFELFEGRYITIKSLFDQEERYMTTGKMNGVFVTLIWTPRPEAVRIISFRRARNEERRKYRKIYG